MIILRQSLFSSSADIMVDDIVDKLESKGVLDFEVTDKIPKDVISMEVNNNGDINFYIPRNYEYTQYDIDDAIRSLSPGFRTRTELDRDIYVMKLTTGKLNSSQCSKVVEKIIDVDGFCSIVVK